MSKKKTLIAFIILAIVGSLVAFYASNLFFADVANFANGIIGGTTIIVSLTALLLGALFVTALLYVARSYNKPQYKKRMAATYLIIGMVLSFLGLLTALLGGIIHYGSPLAPYPFPGFLIIMMVVHFAIFVCALITLLKFVKPLPKDQEKKKITVKHVFYTLGWFLFVSMTLNRFGAFLFLPSYVSFRNLEVTFLFYLYLLVPMAILVKKGLDVLEINFKKMVYSWALLGVSLALLIAIVLIGRSDTAFVSAVSPCMPLERLASKPLEIIIQSLSYFSLLIFYAIVETKNRKVNAASSEEAKPQE